MARAVMPFNSIILIDSERVLSLIQRQDHFLSNKPCHSVQRSMKHRRLARHSVQRIEDLRPTIAVRPRDWTMPTTGTTIHNKGDLHKLILMGWMRRVYRIHKL